MSAAGDIGELVAFIGDTAKRAKATQEGGETRSRPDPKRPGAPAKAAAPKKPRPVREGEGLQWFEADDFADDLVLSGETKGDVETLARELRYVDRFVEAGVDAPSRAIFSGDSGVGKTLTARWIAKMLDVPVALSVLASTHGSRLSDTERTLGEQFAAARKAGAILFLDEIDAIGQSRGLADSDAGRHMERTTSALLQLLDLAPAAQIVFAATNLYDKLDPALRRRFSYHVRFERPDRAARARLVDRWLSKAPVTLAERAELVARTEGCSGAELRGFAMRVGRAAVVRAVDLEEQGHSQLDLASGGSS